MPVPSLVAKREFLQMSSLAESSLTQLRRLKLRLA